MCLCLDLLAAPPYLVMLVASGTMANDARSGRAPSGRPTKQMRKTRSTRDWNFWKRYFSWRSWELELEHEKPVHQWRHRHQDREPTAASHNVWLRQPWTRCLTGLGTR
ncbi:hypothetical protein QBC37DRAFT_435285 [Rhypophila decipiens]|uniref:Secreted protein n=1 Tax=Rhypophila decipiens TaxID=261697 RepID=A0AAN6XX87_9PEZI|nr:hypothetical protein QBC37DRAFT_435285 [Rhypophila decipiens]